MDLTNDNLKLNLKIWEFTYLHGSNKTSIHRMLFEEFGEIFDYLYGIITFKEFNKRTTGYYFNIAAQSRINGIDQPNTLEELVSFTKYVIKDHGEPAIYAEFYIIFHKVLTKYLSFEEPKSNILLFLVKNIMIGFRDYLRGQATRYRKYRNNISMELIDIPIYDKYNFVEDDVYNIGGLYGGLESIDNRLYRYILFLSVKYNFRLNKISKTFNLNNNEIKSFIQRRINESKG